MEVHRPLQGYPASGKVYFHPLWGQGDLCVPGLSATGRYLRGDLDLLFIGGEHWSCQPVDDLLLLVRSMLLDELDDRVKGGLRDHEGIIPVGSLGWWLCVRLRL